MFKFNKKIAKWLVQPGWAYVDELPMLFQMRCYWSKSIGWSIGKYRTEYRELNLLFLNHNFSILPDTRIGPYRGVSAYRAVSDTGTAPILKYRWFIVGHWRIYSLNHLIASHFEHVSSQNKNYLEIRHTHNTPSFVQPWIGNSISQGLGQLLMQIVQR